MNLFKFIIIAVARFTQFLWALIIVPLLFILGNTVEVLKTTILTIKNKWDYTEALVDMYEYELVGVVVGIKDSRRKYREEFVD